MKLRHLLLIILVSSIAVSVFSTYPQPPTVVFDPPILEVTRDSTGYVQKMISVRSSTGDTVRLLSINGSCRCATGSVQRPIAHDTTAGKIFLAINAKHFTDSVNYVDYTIGHSGANSPSVYRVVIRVDP
jgi:hypothetical protein